MKTAGNLLISGVVFLFAIAAISRLVSSEARTAKLISGTGNLLGSLFNATNGK